MIPRLSSLGFGFRFIITLGLPSFVQHSFRFHGLIQDTHVIAINSEPKNLFEVEVKKIHGKGYGIQVFSFQHVDNLFNEIMRIEEEYKKTPMVHASVLNGIRVYRLIIGPYNDRDQASRKLKKLHKKGKEGFVISLENLK